MSELFDILANPAFWIATLRVATPLILGKQGELMFDRAGVLNLGIEGIMVAGSALMGVAGSFLTLSAFTAFFFNMINGRGWICVALVVFASWRPGKALLGALLFAFFDALQLRLQQSGDAVLPYQLYLMLPYLLSILALVLVARKASYPQALMKPYRKGER